MIKNMDGRDEYYNQKGFLRVPAYECDDDLPLGAWIEILRRSYQNGTYNGDKIDALNQIKMILSFKNVEVDFLKKA